MEGLIENVEQQDVILTFTKEAEDFEEKVERTSYLRYRLDLSKPVPKPEYLFSINTIPTMPVGELIGIKGRAKQGKSQLVYLLTGMLLRGGQVGCVRTRIEAKKVLLFDTEQSKSSLQAGCKRALRLAGLPEEENDPRLIPFSLRNADRDTRCRVIEDAIEREKPQVVIIDGIRDLLTNFNDVVESDERMQWLLRLIATHGCTIFCLLHQNKAREDTNMRGHLGTELLNKVYDCIEVGKQDGVFKVTHSDSRDVSFGSFTFRMDIQGNYSVDDKLELPDKKAKKREEKRTKLEESLQRCFEGRTQLTCSELVKAMKNEMKVSEREAFRRKKEALESGLLVIDSDSNYRLANPAPDGTNGTAN